MRITVFREDARSLSAKERLEREPCIANREGNMIILPIPTTKDKLRVLNSEIPLLSVASELKASDIAVGYGLPEEFLLACYLRGAIAVDIATDEEYQLEGAYLTALGCIEYILSEYSVTPSELSFGVIGYGRIGKALSALLLMLGAKLTVYSSKALTNTDFERLPYEALPLAADMKFDVLINTAPARLLPECAFKESEKPLVLELASGDNLPSDISVTKLMQLPVKAFPKSAGRAVARAVTRSLISNTDDGAKL